MGEVLFKRVFLLFLLVYSVVVFSVGVFSAVHPLYSGFSSANSGFGFNNNTGLVSVSDTAVYRVGYYSVNGGAWQSFTLAGVSYNGDVNWLSGSTSHTLPVFGVGEHYVIVYSCTYSAGNSSWDCHDNKWQLIVINNTPTTIPNCTNNCSSLGYQCGIQTICGSSVNCGNCTFPQTCNATNMCSCTPETNAAFCNRLNKNCGNLTALDNCDVLRTVPSCGICSTGYTCNANGTCIINCTDQASSACYDGDVYWYDSCGAIGGIRYDCNSSQICSNGVCVTSQPGTCGGQTCKSNEYCSNNVCLLTVPGNTYFVSTTGNDNNPGTFSQPWKTWQKAFTSTNIGPGDIVYIRGGTYLITVTSGVGYSVTRAGTADNWIIYSNYPGERPILDCSEAVPTSGGYNVGFGASTNSGANYIKFKGLTVRNVFQVYTDRFIEVFGIGLDNGNFIVEDCVAYNIEGVCFASSFYNGWPNVNGEHHFINSDAHDCIDYHSPPDWPPGNRGAGFASHNWYGAEGKTYFTGSRAWNCSDQGFSPNGENYNEVNGCWSFNNGIIGGDGSGFKLGWHDNYYPENNGVNVVLRNSIAVNNRMAGINTNDADGIATGMNVYNNLVYRNGYLGGNFIKTGFLIFNTPDSSSNELKRTFKNNLAYDNEGGSIYLGQGVSYTHSHNSWDSSIIIDSNDFVALPATSQQTFELLSAPRNADRSLPDLGDYFKLAPGSDLIDAGTIIPGYHCSTVGAHPGENCREWYGNAPDLGPFESNY